MTFQNALAIAMTRVLILENKSQEKNLEPRNHTIYFIFF